MKKLLGNIIALLIPFLLIAQEKQQFHIDWYGPLSQQAPSGTTIINYGFNEATHLMAYGALPLFTAEYQLPPEYFEFSLEIKVIREDTIETKTVHSLTDIDLVTDEYQYNIEYNSKYSKIFVLPFRRSPNGDLIRLTTFELLLDPVPDDQQLRSIAVRNDAPEYTTNSVFSSGTWYKMGITKTGVHKLSYSDLQVFGIEPASIDPIKLGIFGNYDGMLPESNEKSRPDDPLENSIVVFGEDDGTFDPEDYILFYAQAPTTWRYNLFTGRFDHEKNLYTDTTYYFLTTDVGTNKRIQSETSLTNEPTEIVTSFYDYDAHQDDLESIMYSGKEWYGEQFTTDTSERIYSFHFPNLKKDRPVYLHFEMVARGLVNTYAEVYANDNLIIDSARFVKISSNSAIKASKQSRKITFFTDNDQIDLKVKYYTDDPAAIGWLNFLEVNVEREMHFPGGQMPFCEPHVSASGNITKFIVDGVNEGIAIWDITDPFNPLDIEYNYSANELDFTLSTDTLRYFTAFDQSAFYKPVSMNPVPNQNLHSISDVNFVIVSPEEFNTQAERLARLHADVDGLTSIVVTPDEIYNEFSSGSQDVSAIRDFMRLLWLRGAFGQDPGYLLLFGDASFDYKHRIHGNTNIVPTYQSEESLRETQSYVTDDFFGLLDDDEGYDCRGNLDIGIGRFPVSTVEEATTAVDKVEHYMIGSSRVMKPWRNTICYIADDADHNLHLHQAKYLINTADTVGPFFNQNKIFSDAYTKVKVPGGKRFPEVNQKIINQVEQGALIINYTGHGGLIGWSEELILDVPTIRSFDNIDNMPLFITATCEFSRFDNPEFVSAGEYLYLNEKGGAIALLTTTRLAFAAANIIVNQRIYQHFIEREDGERPRLGDLVRLSKIPSNDNFLNFALLGDPALRLAYPAYSIATTEFNNNPVVANQIDTVQALSVVTIKGNIIDDAGNKMNHFNGFLYTKVFDKPSEYMTLGTETDSSPEEFTLMDKVLFNGKTTIVNGEFELSFMVPKDITYRYGFGKVSYYAVDTSSFVDAWGAYNQMYIGGLDDQYEPDMDGPEITLYLNDKRFSSGDEVPPNSNFYAELYDEQGIHATGHSLGRDITMVKDEDYINTKVMNDYFEPDIDTYKSGKISYLLNGLSDGWHTITLKAWDLQNNSSESTINFYVDENAEILLSNVYNYPNPFKVETSFGFVHNKNGSILDVELQIFDMHGRFVYSKTEKVGSEGSSAQPIKWDGKDRNGNPLPTGLYTYQIIVSDYLGNTSVQQQKLIKLGD